MIASTLRPFVTLAFFALSISAVVFAEAEDRVESVAETVERIGKRTSADIGARAAREPIATRADLEAATPTSANPFVSFLAEGVDPDYRYWKAKIRFDSWDQAAVNPRPRRRSVTLAETEDNDSFGTANPLPGLAAGSGSLVVTGATDSLSTLFPPVDAPESGACSNDSFSTATPISSAFLNVGARVAVNAAIGDCSLGAADVDYYSFFLAPGDTLTVDVNAGGSPDTYAIIYGESPYFLLDFSFSDPYASPFDPDAFASATAPAFGEYWVVVGSTAGTGAYEVLLGKNTGLDTFSVELEAGDVIGVASDIVAELSIIGPDSRERFGSSLALNDLYPANSPLPTTATGSEASDVVRENGTHYIRLRSVDEFPTPYSLAVQVFRPGTEQATTQTIFIDFDGETINADALFDSGPAYFDVTLSPLSAFLANWGMSGAEENLLVSQILATIEENLNDLASVHPAFSFQLLNSRDDPDPFGQPGVSRVIIGGTQDQLGRDTIAVSSSIDPGNFGLEDTAVVLLDLLSGPAGSSNSLNRFTLWPGTTKIDVVGLGVGNIASHEIGHFLGDWHTQSDNATYALVDSGGNLSNILGSDDDTIGDFDDQDVDFVEDLFQDGSGVRGVEDQAARTSFALTSATLLFVDGFETGDVSAWNEP